ncbi:MAG: hypothetical protein ABSB18_06435 [Candidatus Omnitrophota bacterium]
MKRLILSILISLCFISSGLAAQKIQFRRDVAATWTSVNPTLASGEIGLETDTGKFKMGDGTTAWTSLAYFSAGAIASYPGAGIAVSTGSGWNSSITDNHSNWDTAYGWGNHSQAGYSKYEFGANDFNGTGDFTTTSNVSAAEYYGNGSHLEGVIAEEVEWSKITGNISNQTDLQEEFNSKVSNTTTVNGHALSANITVNKTDIGLGNVSDIDTTNPANITQDSDHRFVNDTEKSDWNAKADYEFGAHNFNGTGNFTTPGNISAGNLSGTINPANVTQDTTHRFVSDANISNWNAKPTTSSTDTFTNKRNQKRIDSQTTTNTITPEISTYDIFVRSAQAHDLVINNHSTSTPADGETMEFIILSDATPRAITYGDKYVAKSGIALPTTTVASKCTKMLFQWRASISQWDLIASTQEA